MAVLLDNLVAEYVMALAKNGLAPGSNSDPTGTLFDLIGAHPGTLNNFAYTSTSGYCGSGILADPYGLAFDSGGDDGVNLGNDWVSNRSAFTIEAWGKPAASYATAGRIIDGHSGSAGLLFGPNSAGVLHFAGEFSGGNSIDSDLSGTSGILGGVHHMVVGYDSADKYVRWYVDGSFINTLSVTLGGSIKPTTGQQVCLGNRASDHARSFGGPLYVVRFYSTWIGGAAVLQNYQAGVLDDGRPWHGVTITHPLGP